MFRIGIVQDDTCPSRNQEVGSTKYFLSDWCASAAAGNVASTSGNLAIHKGRRVIKYHGTLHSYNHIAFFKLHVLYFFHYTLFSICFKISIRYLPRGIIDKSFERSYKFLNFLIISFLKGLGFRFLYIPSFWYCNVCDDEMPHLFFLHRGIKAHYYLKV